ncbi:MAG: hypothetical protein JXQ30_12690 [Spirochaetes bacterium]|nr:hypothetical protein [Spirochaetota bacterium]
MRTAIQKLVETYFDNSVEEAMTALIEYNSSSLSDEDLNRLIDNIKKQKGAVLNSMFIIHISQYLSSMLFSTFIKGVALLIGAVLIQPFLRKVSSNLKHVFWLTMLAGIVLMPVCFSTISPEFFSIVIRPRSSLDTLRILNSVFPRYYEIGAQIQPEAGSASVTDTTQSMGSISLWAVLCAMLWIAGVVVSLIRVLVLENPRYDFMQACRSVLIPSKYPASSVSIIIR